MKLHLGCGNKYIDGFINIDANENVKTDICGDILEYCKSLEDNCVEYVLSNHVFEHLSHDYTFELLTVLADKARNDSKIEITVPHASNPYFYSDPTHDSAIGIHRFSYYCEDLFFQRNVPEYCRVDNLRLTNVRLRFLSPKKGLIGNTVSRFLNKLVNTSSKIIESYEFFWSYIFPIYEVTFSITVSKSSDIKENI